MAQSPILGGDRAPTRPAGRDTDLLGPSDRSDSGSDVQNEHGFDALDPGEVGGERDTLDADSDAGGTGEHGAAVHDSDILEGADIAPDRIERVDDGPRGRLSREDIETLAADDDVEGDVAAADADDADDAEAEADER
jgi:hypothetical protein